MDQEDQDIIDLDNEQLTAIAKPFAHVAMRNQFLSKHGREILDSKDAIEAAVILFMWFGRVNRVAKKYRPRHQKTIPSQGKVEKKDEPVDSGPDVSPGPGQQFGAVGAGFN